jgi:hypothetical protein
MQYSLFQFNEYQPLSSRGPYISDLNSMIVPFNPSSILLQIVLPVIASLQLYSFAMTVTMCLYQFI